MPLRLRSLLGKFDQRISRFQWITKIQQINEGIRFKDTFGGSDKIRKIKRERKVVGEEEKEGDERINEFLTFAAREIRPQKEARMRPSGP